MQNKVVVLGAGPLEGIGAAVARRFAREELHVFVSGSRIEKVEESAQQIIAAGGSAQAVRVDVTSQADIESLFDLVWAHEGDLEAVIFNAGGNTPDAFEDLAPEAFEQVWRVCCFGAFLTAKQALPILRTQGFGSMLYTGASASLRGKPNYAQFASAKAALRNLVQALAREYGPHGVHIAHVIIDGVVNGERAAGLFGEYLEKLGPDGTLQPDDIASAYWMLHQQPRSTWTHELDLRPFKEAW
ncbi:MAG: SDR family oxidoreductase [Erythrobacteraceae bacterium]|jgi:NAD(P)-dependent dehydrogenase (short-subunit alcohol dehydrogenase family)|nr:SDR family oxidoreductase [Erythrobacteraceae bacterium]